MDPPPPPDEFPAAIRAHEAGDLDRAEAAYRRILAAHPGHADALHMLGVLEHQRGRHDGAIGLISRAIGLAPGRASSRNNLGVVLRAAGRLAEAEAAHREALRLVADYPDALANLGVVLHERGRPDEARVPLEAALRLSPDHVNALFAMANLLHECGDSGRAVALYRRAHAREPRRADILNNLGTALGAIGDIVGALEACRLAAAAGPSDPAVLAGLGQALERLDRVEEAAEVYGAAGRLRPGEVHWAVRGAALCPAVFPDSESIGRHRAGLEAVLDAHQGSLALEPGEVMRSGCRPSFEMAHQGRHDREIRAKFAGLFRDAFPGRRPAAGSGLPHVGFVVTRGREGSFARGTAGIVDGLEPGRFRVSIFASPGGLAALRSAIRRRDVEFVPIPDRLPAAADRIEAARCDVLYHWQIGLDPLGYFLPFARPAAVQCTSWGTHVTSGIPAVDYYLSSELIEPEGAEAHYSEELVQLATLPTFQRPVSRPGPPARRSEFGLPEGRALYTCLQRVAKFHPDFEGLLGEILRRDRTGLVVLLEDAAPRATERLRSRLEAAMPEVAGRVVFLPRRPRVEYLRLLSLSDVVLDPTHYGAGVSAYDILGLGLPLVTLPGALHVGRYALGCYRKMGLTELVADTPGRYVDLAVRLGLDAEYRADAAARVVAAAPVLFEDAAAVAEHGRFFERATAEARGRG